MCRLEDLIRNEALHSNHYDALIKVTRWIYSDDC